ncbi:Short-chain dehydrogenase/reductase SDR [Penicillium expansum]|uniref:Short-chain dehydrogenase/reductase SDR n=1 Tax=Penicillium expansum TaxID=27334 RepID=A0A0A2JLC0_PENEN|nr:Short-chain dehydrogenase/reductase SDR [Penicillium expansum]KGO42135.1 Short-chain dehydrogenase/reductase SDR [Penicillium expansum]KGO56177.1 Short-chain dehydrogenase/reductase SDR [Penicillium expansum]KGO66662.1 Short-chain dehydrogenase/reductase SDR [Penicillium expansum]
MATQAPAMTTQTATFTKPNRPLTWLITGCSSGLGLSLARTAQSNGHKVIATSRQPSRTPELVSEITQNGGEWHTLDVDSPTAASELVSKLESAGHYIDVLVNNAGYAILGAVEQFSDEELRSQMETVYFGPSRLLRAVVPRMRERRFGVIVNVSSGAGLEGRESMGAYAAAKAAMDGLCKVLAKEVAPFNVRLLTVWLGVFNTQFGTGCRSPANPLPVDYSGSVAAKTLDVLLTGKLVADGDKDKAAKAMYEVVVGEGVGVGHESEGFLPLGRDMIPRVELVRDRLVHALDVFGDTAGNVYVDKE